MWEHEYEIMQQEPSCFFLDFQLSCVPVETVFCLDAWKEKISESHFIIKHYPVLQKRTWLCELFGTKMLKNLLNKSWMLYNKCFWILYTLKLKISGLFMLLCNTAYWFFFIHATDELSESTCWLLFIFSKEMKSLGLVLVDISVNVQLILANTSHIFFLYNFFLSKLYQLLQHLYLILDMGSCIVQHTSKDYKSKGAYAVLKPPHFDNPEFFSFEARKIQEVCI